jgi:hypothetical protein
MATRSCSVNREGPCAGATDLTAQFLHLMRTELEGMQVRADAVAEVFGSGEFTERMKRRQATIAAVDAGFLRRELFVARAGR